MAQQAQYTVSMTRPDRKRVVVRRLFETAPIPAATARQLAGYLTHKLFADNERGGAGTFYTITERVADKVRVYTVERTPSGHYIHA